MTGRTVLLIVVLLPVLIVRSGETAFSQSVLDGNVHLGLLRVADRKDSDPMIGGRLTFETKRGWAIEGNLDWVLLETLSGPESSSDYDALLYSGVLTYRFERNPSAALFLGTGIGAATFLLHDVPTTNESADTRWMIPVVSGIEWVPYSSSSTAFRLDLRDNIILGDSEGLVGETRSTSHNVEISLGVSFALR